MSSLKNFNPFSKSLIESFPFSVSSRQNTRLLCAIFDLANKTLTALTDAKALNASWQKEEQNAKEKLLEEFSNETKEKISSFKNAVWSPDDTKILYEKEDGVYVFDLKPQDLRKKEPEEHTIYKKEEGSFIKIYWYPDSQHVLVLKKDSIETQMGTVEIIEINGENNMQIFSGAIVSDYLFPYTDGSKVVILTTFNPESKQYNLYSINLR